jgi:CspA family cold shock protein
MKTMKTGTVTWFNPQKGFGFIRPDDGGPNIFVHIREVERAGLGDLKEGQRIAFGILPEKRMGWACAVSLAPLESVFASREDQPSEAHSSPAAPPVGGRFTTKNPARHRHSPSPFATVSEMISSALYALLPPPNRNA